MLASSLTRRSIAALILLAFVGPASLSAEKAPTLKLSGCELRGSGGYAAVHAKCGRLMVPADYSDAKSGEVSLFVAVLPARSQTAAADAFTFLAGGPGQAATTAFVDLSPAFESVRKNRDVVLVDQRGTGRSGALECEQEEELMGVSPSPGQVIASLRDCLGSLSTDPRLYTTSPAVRDLERVREALGYTQLSVYGGSYGTRVGLHYLRRYPASVRTLILDGVVPADLNLGPGIAIAAQDALENMFSRCADADACSARFGDLRQKFASLGDQLKRQPAVLSLPHPIDGTRRQVTFDYNRFAIAIRLLSYAPETVALMPLLLHEAASGNQLAPLAAQAVMVEESLSEALSFGMHNSVVCTEDAPFYKQEVPERGRLKETYLGDSQLGLLESICEVWPSGVIDQDFKEPVVSDLPVLLLSGSADPVTPPEYAERAAATLDHHLHLVGRNMGHILAPVGCVPKLIARYVEEASLENIDARCLENARPMPFFTSFSGPRP